MALTREQEDALSLHNEARAELKGGPRPPLKWDPALAAEANKWAKVLAQRDKTELEHANQKKHGENLFEGHREGHGDGSQVFNFTWAMALRKWIEERSDYQGEKVGESPPSVMVGHYTQLIWPACTHVGMAKAISPSGKTYVVARYNTMQHGGKTPYDSQKGNIFTNRKWEPIKGHKIPKSIVVEKVLVLRGEAPPPGFVKVEKTKSKPK